MTIYSIAFLVGLFACSLNELQQEDSVKRQLYLAQLDTGHGALEFELLVEYSPDGTPQNGFIINGAERIPVNVSQTKLNDILIDFPHYDSSIRASFRKGTGLTGTWNKRRGDDDFAKMEFEATAVDASEYKKRLDEFESPENFIGRWEVKFEGDEQTAIADFKQEKLGNRVAGTFLTTTGDYRFLSGFVAQGQLTLSCFDGAHAFLFHAKLDDSGRINGKFYSGNWHQQSWTAVKNAVAKLPDATSLTKLTDQITLEEMVFPNLKGEQISLRSLIEGKPAIIEVFGSWCPNCHDAARYLAELDKKYKGDELAIVGLAFELTGDFERNAEQVKRYMLRHEVVYPVLIAGPSDKQKATEKFKFLDRIRSYPTFIFVDKAGAVTSIYQGFSGPATGDAYKELQSTFEKNIRELIAK